MIGSISTFVVENKSAQKDLAYWEAQVETPREPVTSFQSATLETLAKEREEAKKKRGGAKNARPRIHREPKAFTKPATIATYFTHAEDKVNSQLRNWGDGDGSYFDRWLAVTPPTKTHKRRGTIVPTQGYKAEILRRKEVEWEERKARIPQETPQEKSSYSATKRDFEDMFYHSSDSDVADDEEEDIDSLRETLHSPIQQKNDVVLEARLHEKTIRHHEGDFELSPRSKKYIGSAAKYRLFQKYHKEAKAILRLPPLRLPIAEKSTTSPLQTNDMNQSSYQNDNENPPNKKIWV